MLPPARVFLLRLSHPLPCRQEAQCSLVPVGGDLQLSHGMWKIEGEMVEKLAVGFVLVRKSSFNSYLLINMQWLLLHTKSQDTLICIIYTDQTSELIASGRKNPLME